MKVENGGQFEEPGSVRRGLHASTSLLLCTHQHRLRFALVCLLTLGLAFADPGGSTLAAAEGGFAKEDAALIRQFCIECHGNEVEEAHVNLESLAAEPDFGRRFRTWEKVVGMLGQGKMPPDYMPQPSETQRSRLVAMIRKQLDDFMRENAGDPGRVVIRRLTSAEYAYTIEDLTGLRLSWDDLSVGDAVGGEGFTNVGDVQFVQDSTLERYLEAAKRVASHAVVGAGPLDFFADPGQTGQELSAIHRIQALYRAHGFRTAAGEGAEPFGLHRYPKALFVAWQFQHREALGQADATLAELAEDEDLAAGFVEHLWNVLNESAATFPTSEIVQAWRALPAPAGDDAVSIENVRSECDTIYELLRRWQSTLAATAGDEEEAPVLTADSIEVAPTHAFKAELQWAEGAATALADLSVTPASSTTREGSIVIWRSPRVRFGRVDSRGNTESILRDVVTEKTADRLAFGRHPRGGEVGPNDFVLPAGATETIELRVPEGTRGGQLLVDVVLDLEHGDDGVVRCSIADGEVEGETAAETGSTAVLLADPEGAGFPAWKSGVLDFAGKLPEVSHREPTPSDRDPIPAPFDNGYNTTERNLFHYRIKYHRDDDFLVRHLLDDAARERLDQAWIDLLSSFEYHDAYLRQVAEKFGLDLQGQGIADLDPERIERMPAEPRVFVEWLYKDYESAQRALKTAEPGHVEDALRLAERAWRRPLGEQESNRLRGFYASLRNEAQLDHTKAMRVLLARILVAPAFLYRAELPPDETGIVRLSNWELASRLSFFLWSSIPDAELRRAAGAGELDDPQELARQARRMLRDPKARRLAAEFFGQWFGFYRFDDYRGVDAERFPEFTDRLKSAMYDEAVSFFEHIIREDRPVSEILFADYAFWNRELAEHYGADEATAPTDAITLVGSAGQYQRGGLLRLGAVHTVTSAPRRTSAVKRGDWILRRVLGTAVPPPPPDAGSIPADDVRPDGQTVRERLVAHRRKASCVNCHARFDPLGFALEHFDAIGRWRDRHRDGREIDATGVLDDGTEISGPEGLRQYLGRELEQFERTLCVKLLGFALGRSELASDRALIEPMMADLKEDERFSRLVVRVVTSPQFRYRRGRDRVEAASISSGISPEDKGE